MVLPLNPENANKDFCFTTEQGPPGRGLNSTFKHTNVKSGSCPEMLSLIHKARMIKSPQNMIRTPMRTKQVMWPECYPLFDLQDSPAAQHRLLGCRVSFSTVVSGAGSCCHCCWEPHVLEGCTISRWSGKVMTPNLVHGCSWVLTALLPLHILNHRPRPPQMLPLLFLHYFPGLTCCLLWKPQ